MPSVVFCDNKDCCYYDDYHECCGADKLVIEQGVCLGSPRYGRCVSENDLDEKLKSENAKLRDLVRDLWDFAIIGTNTPRLFSAEWHAQACAIRDRARELGAEVAQ